MRPIRSVPARTSGTSFTYAFENGARDATCTVRGDNGTVEVPAEPERVVAAIGSFETDMVTVGVMPVLTTSFAGPWVQLDESVTITDNIPPTAEERARPDLMVGWNWVTQEPFRWRCGRS